MAVPNSGINCVSLTASRAKLSAINHTKTAPLQMAVFVYYSQSCTALLLPQKRISVLGWRIEVFFDGTRRNPTHKVKVTACLVISA